MAQQKMGGCKKRRRNGKNTGNPRAARAGRNMKPRCSRPMTGTYVCQLIAIEQMEPDMDRMLSHKKRFQSLPKNVRKKVYGITRYPY